MHPVKYPWVKRKKPLIVEDVVYGHSVYKMQKRKKSYSVTPVPDQYGKTAYSPPSGMHLLHAPGQYDAYADMPELEFVPGITDRRTTIESLVSDTGWAQSPDLLAGTEPTQSDVPTVWEQSQALTQSDMPTAWAKSPDLLAGTAR